MVVIPVNRIDINGTKSEIDLNCAQIAFVAPYAKETAAKELKEQTCVVAMANGVVLHLEITREKLRGIMLGK